MEFWPNNPDIEKVSQDPLDQGSVRKYFDELFSSRDFRKIYEKKDDFIVPLIGDTERLKQYEEAIRKTSTIEILLIQVKDMLDQELPYAAWDLVLQAEIQNPEDRKVMRAKTDLSVIALNYATKLRAASDAEKRGDNAIALTRYIEAKRMYPASRTVRDGLKTNARALLMNIDN